MSDKRSAGPNAAELAASNNLQLFMMLVDRHGEQVIAASYGLPEAMVENPGYSPANSSWVCSSQRRVAAGQGY